MGELLLIKQNEQFPCDMIFLKSSLKQGNAYVDTMNLDGEVF